MPTLSMLDAILILSGLAFFAVAVAYQTVCDRL
jgi:hypothetical protein